MFLFSFHSKFYTYVAQHVVWESGVIYFSKYLFLKTLHKSECAENKRWNGTQISHWNYDFNIEEFYQKAILI